MNVKLWWRFFFRCLAYEWMVVVWSVYVSWMEVINTFFVWPFLCLFKVEIENLELSFKVKKAWLDYQLTTLKDQIGRFVGGLMTISWMIFMSLHNQTIKNNIMMANDTQFSQLFSRNTLQNVRKDSIFLQNLCCVKCISNRQVLEYGLQWLLKRCFLLNYW